MARKSKANGKAKREKLPTFAIGDLPIREGRWTPKQARQWMDHELPEWLELLHVFAIPDVDDTHARMVVPNVGFAVQRMVEAMTWALEAHEPVTLESEIGPAARALGPANVEGLASFLALVLERFDPNEEPALYVLPAIRRVAKFVAEQIHAMAEAEREASREQNRAVHEAERVLKAARLQVTGAL